jgi:hypothetical protein
MSHAVADGISCAVNVVRRRWLLSSCAVRALAAQLGGHIEVDRRLSGTTQRLVFPVTAPGDAG